MCGYFFGSEEFLAWMKGMKGIKQEMNAALIWRSA
jgi:hypothetical protein